MRTIITLAVVVCSLGLAACGGGGGGGCRTNCGGPMTYTLASDMYEKFPGYFGLTFSVPAASTLDFNVAARSSTTPDHWDFGVFTATEYNYYSNGMQSSAYSPAQNVTSTSGSVSVPAGDYVLGFHCANLVEACEVSIDLSATY
jgi:hypothetical protein